MASQNVPIGINRFEEDQTAFLNRLKNELEDGFNKPDEIIEITYEKVIRVCEILKDIFSREPLILEVQSPIYVMGDIHGQFYDLLRIFRQIGHTENRFIFLGDYVDRGSQSLEVIVYLFVLKALYPNKYFPLRGNHEDFSQCSKYGFKQEVRDKLIDYTCFYDIIDVFNVMPISALIDGRVFCVHGGISRELIENEWGSFQEVFENIQRPICVNDSSIVRGLLWSDPIPDSKRLFDVFFIANPKRGSKIEAFGNSATRLFFLMFNLNKLLRGHEFCPAGYKYDHLQKCLTIFSAPNYRKTNTVGAYLLTNNTEDSASSYQIIGIFPARS
ncbi:unnamed protein product [Hymenolepis diminuta]|uniref:Serine/threonine-protein phosphatase n=1 Tax=Hymenolepis diminuta TaxID=6216 RepID=A0A564YJ01_HYMDI|nr:unnamed protein product [Hymenolepis diminuta]